MNLISNSNSVEFMYYIQKRENFSEKKIKLNQWKFGLGWNFAIRAHL